MPTLVIAGQSHALSGEVILGRHRDCGLRISDQAASRQHARIFHEGDAWWIEDLGSANGTRLNDQPLTARARLVHGMDIVIGQQRVRFADDQPTAVVAEANIVDSTIAGYRIDRQLFRGPTGVVYVARQLNLERDVAFKVVTPALASGAGFVARFLTGMGKAASLQDEGFVRVHESGLDAGHLWYSMELVQGESLDARLARDRVVAPELVVAAGESVARVLHAAHLKGVFHHDLRPAVMLIGNSGHMKLCDVGLAAIFGRGRFTVGMPVSSAWYLAPEQIRGERVDARTDVYQLGAVLWHCVVGQPIFSGVTAKEVAKAHLSEQVPAAELSDLSRPLAALLVAMLHKDPARRPQSASEVAQRLAAMVTGIEPRRTPVAHDPGTREQVRKHALQAQARSEARERQARSRTLITWAVIIVVAIALIFVGSKILGPAMGAPASPMPSASAPQSSVSAGDQRVDGTGETVGRTTEAIAAIVPIGPDPRLTAFTQELQRLRAEHQWAAAEGIFRRYRAATAAQAPGLLRAIDLAAGQLAVDASQWARRELEQLPRSLAPTPAQLSQRLKGLSDLRQRVATAQRSEVDGQWAETIALLAQKVQDARRKARVALEDNRFADLAGAAAGLAPYVAGTPLLDLHKRLEAETQEAARLRKGWRSRVAQAKGQEALATIAGLRLLNLSKEAREVLARLGNDRELLLRYQRFTGGSALIAKFDDPGDLAVIEVDFGEVEMRSGTLTAKAGEPASVQVPVPAGTCDILVKSRVVEQNATATAVLRIGDWLVIDLVGSAAKVRIGTSETLLGGVAMNQVHVIRRAGHVTVLSGERVVGEGRAPETAAALNFVVNGCEWALDEIQIIGE